VNATEERDKRTPPGGAPPSRVGPYKLMRLLRDGGTAQVFEALHDRTGARAVVKTMNTGPARDVALQSALLRQAEALARLKHPHVVAVTDFGFDGGLVYLVTDVLQGEDLAARVARTPGGLDPGWTVDVLLAVCAGVSAAHGAGVVHHNLQSESIFLTGAEPQVLDFGVANLLAARSHGLTSPGSPRGTVYFLSPEQVRGDLADGRSDEYALGVVLYQCLTGQLPHLGDSSYAIMSKIVAGHFPLPRQLRPDLPAGLEAVVMRAMAGRPVERFPTVHELGRALLPFASPAGGRRWSSHFSGPPGPMAPAVWSGVARRPRSVEPPPIFPPAGPGAAHTLIGYRAESLGAAELTERVRRPEPPRRRRRGLIALALGSLAGGVFSLGALGVLPDWLAGTSSSPPGSVARRPSIAIEELAPAPDLDPGLILPPEPARIEPAAKVDRRDRKARANKFARQTPRQISRKSQRRWTRR
jgi:tRNA A-37 threonylcarbamoyl transferase component Bud32